MKSQVMKFKDLVCYITLHIMYRAIIECPYFQSTKGQKINEEEIASVVVSTFWNYANIEIRMCKIFLVFKQMVCKAISDLLEI